MKGGAHVEEALPSVSYATAFSRFLLCRGIHSGRIGTPAGDATMVDVTPEQEIPSPHYDSILYSESRRAYMRSRKTADGYVKVMGNPQPRDLYLAIVAAPVMRSFRPLPEPASINDS